MWTAEKIYYQGSSNFIRAYQGTELVWEQPTHNYITFTAKADNSSIGLSSISSGQTLEYSTNGNTWSNITTATTISLTSGQSVYVRGILSSNNSDSNYTQFIMSGDIKASGNINYLWDKDNPDTALKNGCGIALFSGCTALTDVVDLELPATTLAERCYRNMFRNTGITTAPVLPATTLATHCYSSMFNNCILLTSAPALPSTTLATYCYFYMFENCYALTTAPELPAPTLMNFCYNNMFKNCISLNYIKCLATDRSASNCTVNWVRGVALSGTFVKDASMTSWIADSVNGIPSGWTVKDSDDNFNYKHWQNGGVFTLPTRWNNNYYLELDYYATVTTTTTGHVVIGSNGVSPAEFVQYSRGFYFDIHYPNSTTSATTKTNDYDKRISKFSGINNSLDGRKCTLRLCCGTTGRAKIVDISGTTIWDQTTSVASQSYCTTEDYKFRLTTPSAINWHTSDFRVYDNDNTLIHNFQLYPNPNSNYEYQYLDRITNTWIAITSGSISDVTTTDR